jgi:hypothetical protein
MAQKHLHLLTAAAIAALVAGAPLTSCKSTKDGSSASASAKHGCKGMNACKGQGGCSTGDNKCKGQNSCKGKGGCATDKHACKGANGCKGAASCKSSSACKGK